MRRMLAPAVACWRALAALGFGALGLVSIGLGCGNPPEDVTRSVVLHTLPSCPLPGPAPVVDLEALGDFPAGPKTGEAPREPGQRLVFPPETRSIVARAEAAPASFFGYSEAAQEGDLDVLLWPRERICD